VLGALGKRETDDGVVDLQPAECAPVRRQSMSVVAMSLALGVLVAILSMVV
jgi:hypothetical protein